MNDDILRDLADLEKRGEELVERARKQAVAMRAEVERKLESVAEELRSRGITREIIEREINKRRAMISQEFEQRMRQSMEKLDMNRREKVKPVVERMIKAFHDRSK